MAGSPQGMRGPGAARRGSRRLPEVRAQRTVPLQTRRAAEARLFPEPGRPAGTRRRRWAASPAATTPASTGWPRSRCICIRRLRRT